MKKNSSTESIDGEMKHQTSFNEVPLLPTFQECIFENLPSILEKAVEPAKSDEERDMLLLGALGVISSCLPNVYGFYGRKIVYSNLYLFISAQAASGKGGLNDCKRIVAPIHDELRRQSNIAREQFVNETKNRATKSQNNNADQSLKKPVEKMLFIPANNSSAGINQTLCNNSESGLIFETEGDTLTNAFKSDFGNYSDAFRKAFQHEPITSYRKTDQEYLEIKKPRLSVVLSGTPKQVLSLIPSAENGLFSRFIYYHMNTRLEWIDVFSDDLKMDVGSYYDGIGKEFYQLYNTLNSLDKEIEFSFTSSQKTQFHEFFENNQSAWATIQGFDITSVIRRLGLVTFRLGMVLSVLRFSKKIQTKSKIYCQDDDFGTIIKMVQILMRHSDFVYGRLPKQPSFIRQKNLKEQFLDSLPDEFDRQEYLQVASDLNIKPKTADKYVSNFVTLNWIQRPFQNQYKKIND